MSRLARWGWLAVFLGGLSTGKVGGQGFPPEKAAKRMKVPEGFQVKLVASEPAVRQPVTISFDDRGRLWVIQYLQYPTPKGLTPVKVDQYLRTVYDRIPEPPPKGPQGADRITILYDLDKHGHYRKAKDFVGGLNLASGMALGHGGVFVVQPPYLLFYPDKKGNDVPDGPPQVLLSGFGMQDAHAFPNSLQWGPDGWLYGAQGSTVTSTVRGIEFQQGIWRYHPVTRKFELFSEGGGNTWGLDFDRHGNVIAGTNWGNKAMLHQVQGGYYIKGFSKHGPLHNPYTYGYFDHLPYQGFKGGHVTCGGILYRGGVYPPEYRDQYVAANPLANAIYWHVLKRQGSSFTAHFGGDLLLGNDTWFRPIDCELGPDGSVFIADWYDKRINHVDPIDNWDRTNGRICKIEYRGSKWPARLGLARWSSKELVGLLGHPNAWFVRQARELLSERRDPSVLPELRRLLKANKGQLAFEALLALFVSGGFNDALAGDLLRHPNEDVRAWTVRFLGDTKKINSVMRDRLASLARTEPSPVVRSQLACSAKRLPAPDCLAIVRDLLRHDEDRTDPHIPLLLWWAIEDKAISARELVLDLVRAPEAWKVPLVRQFIVERLGRRYMDEGGAIGLATCGRLLDMAPGTEEVRLLFAGMEKALEGRHLAQVPAPLAHHLEKLRQKHPDDRGVLYFALRVGSPSAYDRALKLASGRKTPTAERIRLIEILGQMGKTACVPVLLNLLETREPAAVRGAALSALQLFTDPVIAERVVSLYPGLPGALRARAQTLLCSRPASALAFLQAVDAGRIPSKEVPLEQLQAITRFKNEAINQLVGKHWGKVAPATPGEKLTRIRNITRAIRQGKGDLAQGKILFTKHCATCHSLFGEGAKIGPDLTGADRKSLQFLVPNIVDPSAVIRTEYVAYNIETKDGRSLTGLVVESTPKTVTLLDAKNERTVIPRDRIENMAASPVSLMPEKILDPLEDQELRDLFTYLQGEGPLSGSKKK